MSQKAEAYRKQAMVLQAQAKEYNFVPIPYAGGISISDKEIDDDNSDSFRPWFSSGQFQNLQDGAARQSQTGIEYFGSGADS
jgi:hypothetical protein